MSPAGCKQVALSHGLQHENALVRYITLGALCAACSALQPLLADLAAATSIAAAADAEAVQAAAEHTLIAAAAAASAGAVPGGGSAAPPGAGAAAAADVHGSRKAQWAAWGGRLAGWVRGRLPQPQVLMALHAALEAQEVGPQLHFAAFQP